MAWVLTCTVEPSSATPEGCASPVWVEQAASLLAGATWDDVRLIVGALLTLGAVVVILRYVIKWAEAL